MLKPLTRSFTAIALLFLFAASSALGAHHPRSARTRANRHHSARHHLARHRSAGHHAARHRHPRRRSAHRNALVRKASTTATTALLGNEAVESSKDNLISGQAEAFPFQAGISGTAGAVHVYIDSHNGARTLIVGLYTNLNSHPGALLSTGSLSAPQAGAWNTAAVAPTALVSGTTYWLAVLGTGGTLRYRDRWHGPCKAETSRQTNLGMLAAQWSTGTLYSTCPISAYVTPATSTLPEGPLVEVAPVESPPPPPPPPAAPANSSPPLISGTATEGQSLTATTGSWTGSPTSYAYQWEDCSTGGVSCTNIASATISSYTLSSADVGHTVRVVVTATNTGGSTPASSAATATVAADPPPPPPPAPTNTVPPAVSGSAVEGETLSASSGTWTGSPTSFAYQWQDCNVLGEGCSNVSGATASSYKLAVSDVGSTIRVVVIASNAGGSTPASSAATGAILPALLAPTNTAPPAVSGSAVEGETLSASNGVWLGATSFAYQWQDCNSSGESCANVGGATSSIYKLAASDVGSTMRVVVTASNAGGSTPASSAATATVAADPPPPPPPTASFTYSPTSPVAGQPVTLDGTSSTCPDGPCTYAWSDDGSTTRPIPPLWPLGSGQTLQYTFASAGTKYVRLVVTDVTGQTATVEHNVVVASELPPPPTPPTNLTPPAVSGTAQVGQMLSASNGTWSGSTPMTYAYQWQDCNSSGGGCSSIGGATASSYALAAGDVGHTVRVVVTVSNAGGSAAATSGATGEVTAKSTEEGVLPVCTTTVSSLASVVSLSGSEPDGATICIADGSYGTLAMTAARTGYVTIAAASGPGHVTLSGLTVSSGASHLRIDGVRCACNTLLGAPGRGPNNIQIVRTESEGFQVEAASTDLLFDHDYSHNGPYGFLLNGSRHPVPGGCCETANYPFIENVTISNSKVGPVAATGADAFQVKGFKNLTISNNDIYDIYQNGNHNDGVQTVHGGSNLTITHNYFHDGNVELFMIKDGEVEGTNVVTENLVVRENSSLNPACGGCSTAVFGQWYSPQNATIANNTIVEPSLVLRSQLNLVGGGNPYYLVPSGINVNHNVIQQFRAEDDETASKELGLFEPVLTHSYNIFGTWTKNYLAAGPGDTFVSTIGNTSSLFKNPSENDFRLASNPNNIGVNWKPSEYHYGP